MKAKHNHVGSPIRKGARGTRFVPKKVHLMHPHEAHRTFPPSNIQPKKQMAGIQ